MIRVIDDFVNAGYYEAIESGVLTNFVWSWNSTISGGTSNLFGFSHGIFDAGQSSSRFYEFLLPIFIQAKAETTAKVLLRARGDMTVNSGEQITYEPHIDMPGHKEHINMIFYIGDSDGDTIIYKEKFEPVEVLGEAPSGLQDSKYEVPKTLTEEQRISPKANRLVIFNGEHWHTGQSPINHTRRVILNLNFANDDYRMNR